MQRLHETIQNNYRLTQILSHYLTNFPDAITREMIQNTVDDYTNEEEAFALLLFAIYGLDMEDRAQRCFYREYLRPSVRKLDPSVYREDPYFRSVRFPETKIGDWELKQIAYPAYRAFTCDDPVCDASLREIQQVGFFDEEYTFPAVLENGNEWMTLTPVDMDTCQEQIKAAKGKCITFGLGLGYYAFSVTNKPEVTSLTVIERSPDVIALFNKVLLPQFPHPEKLHIVCADAFQYAEHQMPKERFDHAFVDTWRDAGDGLEHYLRMKPLEKLNPHTEFSYWIEKTILSRLRAFVYERLRETETNRGAVLTMLSDKALMALAATGISIESL